MSTLFDDPNKPAAEIVAISIRAAAVDSQYCGFPEWATAWLSDQDRSYDSAWEQHRRARITDDWYALWVTQAAMMLQYQQDWSQRAVDLAERAICGMAEDAFFTEWNSSRSWCAAELARWTTLHEIIAEDP